MSHILKITPELRARLMHAETIEIDDSAGLAAAKARIAELERLIEHMGHKAELYDEACALVGTLGHMNVTNAVSALRVKAAELERVAAIGRRAVEMLRKYPPQHYDSGVDEMLCSRCRGANGNHRRGCDYDAILRDAEQVNSRVILDSSAPEPATVAVEASAADGVCYCCNGRGEVGGFVSADSGYQSDVCPECNGTGLALADGSTTVAVAVDAGALAELLEQAAEDIQEWGAYASGYFQEKHNLAANVAKYREAARRLLAGVE